MLGKFENKVVLVTGAASGIGRATALAFAREGAKVMVADIDVAGGEETTNIIKRAGGCAFFFNIDVSRKSEVASLIDEIVNDFGRLDCAHNNAGIAGNCASTAECTEENWDSTIDVNLKGVWLCMKYEIIQMARQGYGSIVNTSSVAGLVGLKNWPAYVASKHGVLGLTKVAAIECARKGIRVNAVCPNIIQTSMARVFTKGDPRIEEQIVRMTPIGRKGTPEEVAEAVLWLSSDTASYVTGHIMVIDGGMTCQ
ncbi:MAG TPA: SDR family oxidoreductase [Bacteroidetes bacterium]|nr:SDR family oxidoreductase [Bacteroidota bacterium]